MSSIKFHFPQEEAIVKTQDRPVITIQNDTFSDSDSSWRVLLSTYKTRLNTAIRSVGRVELANGSTPYLGTAWMLTKDIAVTNRHVANEFARKEGNKWVFQVNNFRQPLKVRVDFKEEYSKSDVFEADVIKVLYVAEVKDGEPDIAFLKLASNPTRPLPPPLRLYEKVPVPGQKVAAIGYPAKDYRNNANDQARIFDNIYEVKRLSPGFIEEVSEFAFTHDCTTLGGNSGSPVIGIESGDVVGLHFAGRQGVANYAVSANVIREYFEKYVGGFENITLPISVASLDFEVAEESSTPVNAKGYDPKFLGSDKLLVPLPTFTNDTEGDAVEVSPEKGGIEKYLLNYNHFSITMSKSRGFAIYTACNINGSESKKVKRTDNWVFDDRIPTKYQWGNALYKNNDLDRGHLVRRLDPAWGDKAEATAGANDTFYYTNCSPQHKDFNQKTWLGLEDYILNSAITKGFKATVFTGPFYSNNDFEYREAKIPLAYWKVVVMVTKNKEARILSATGYVVSQENLLSSLEETQFVFGKYKTFQTSIKLIEEKANLDFGNLSNFDPLSLGSSPSLRELPDFEAIQLVSDELNQRNNENMDNNETKGRIIVPENVILENEVKLEN